MSRGLCNALVRTGAFFVLNIRQPLEKHLLTGRGIFLLSEHVVKEEDSFLFVLIGYMGQEYITLMVTERYPSLETQFSKC